MLLMVLIDKIVYVVLMKVSLLWLRAQTNNLMSFRSTFVVIQEEWVRDWPLSLTFERWQILEVMLSGRRLKFGHGGNRWHVWL